MSVCVTEISFGPQLGHNTVTVETKSHSNILFSFYQAFWGQAVVLVLNVGELGLAGLSRLAK